MLYNCNVMVDLQKASLTTNGNQVNLTMPISKVDKEKRIVSGFATLDNIDRQGDRVTAEASRKAFENFRGNVRLMHQPIPAGKVVNFRTEPFFDTANNKQYSGVYVDAYISKGASDIWEMVLDGTLTGFSIGGSVKDSENVLDQVSQKTVRIIKDYDLVELSLVDSPANQLANIFSIQKTLDGNPVADGIFNKSNIQNVFWCETDELAYVDENESHNCANCGDQLNSIGWVDENTQEDVTKAVFAMIQKSQDAVTNEDTTNKYPEQNKKFKSELTKRAVVENHPDCNGGFGVVGNDGELKSCHKTRAEAEAAVAAHDSQEGQNHDGEMHMSKKVDENERGHGGKKKEMHKASYSVGDFVQWNSSGGVARGRVTRVVTNGTIKVPNTDLSITGTQDNPAVAIRIYEKDGNAWKPSGTTVGHRMNTLRSWATKFAKSLGVTTGLLPSEVVKMATDLESVAYQKNEGGVEVAENTQEVIKSDEVAEEVVVDEVVEDVEETEEAAVEETVEKSDEVAEETAEETAEAVAEEEVSEEVEAAEASTENGEATEIAKALDDIKNFISETVSTNAATNANAVNEVAVAVADVTKSLTETTEEINKALADVQNALASLNARVDSVESDTAVKKSGELENAPEKTTIMRKSQWGGRFLGSAEYLN